MENKTLDPLTTMAQTLAAIQAQLQSLGTRMNQLERPQPPQPPRAAVTRNITPPQNAMEEDDFGYAPHSYDVDPKPPDPLARISWRLGHHMQHKGYDDPLRPNTSVFVGNNDPQTYIAWEFHMENLFDRHNYNDSEKIDMAVSQLMGNALSWWTREASERRRHHYTQISSWEDLKQHLRKRYVPYSFRKLFPDCFNKLIQSNQEDVQVLAKTKVTSYLNNISISYPMTSIMHLSLSKQAETGLGIIPKLKDSTMSDKEDQNKRMKVLVHKSTQDIPSSLLVKEPNITAFIHAYPSQTKQQDKCLNPYSPSRIEYLCCDADETNLRQRLHENKENANEGQLKIQDNERDSKGVYHNINMEPHNKFKLNQNQGVLYSLLIKEAHPNSHNMILPKLIKSQGKVLNSHFYDNTNLFSLHEGKIVLRTKLKQGGGYDEVIQATINQRYGHKETRHAIEDHVELEEHKHIISLGHNPFMPSEKTGEPYSEFSMIYHSFVWRPGEFLHQIEITKDFIYLPKLSRYKAPNSSHFSQSKHQALTEKEQHLHSFSLDHGFIPLGFPGKVFNEASASQGDTLNGSRCFIAREHSK